MDLLFTTAVLNLGQVSSSRGYTKVKFYDNFYLGVRKYQKVQNHRVTKINGVVVEL